MASFSTAIICQDMCCHLITHPHLSPVLYIVPGSLQRHQPRGFQAEHWGCSITAVGHPGQGQRCPRGHLLGSLSSCAG